MSQTRSTAGAAATITKARAANESHGEDSRPVATAAAAAAKAKAAAAVKAAAAKAAEIAEMDAAADVASREESTYTLVVKQSKALAPGRRFEIVCGSDVVIGRSQHLAGIVVKDEMVRCPFPSPPVLLLYSFCYKLCTAASYLNGVHPNAMSDASPPFPPHARLPKVGGASVRRRNGSPSRSGFVANGQMTKAGNDRVPPPPPLVSPPPHGLPVILLGCRSASLT